MSAPDIERHARRALRREELLQALMPVIDRHLADGVAYSDISVHTLVTESEISRSTFYTYFTDKTDLLRACAEAVFAQTVRTAQEWFELGPDITPQAMQSALGNAVRGYLTHAPLMAAVYDGSNYDPSLRQTVSDIMDGHTDRFESHIVHGQAGGWIDPGLLPRETASWLVWMYERTQHQATHGRSADELERLIREGTGIVWRALYAPIVT